MRSLLFTVTVAAAALVLGGCPYHKQQPVPGPKSATARRQPLGRLTRAACIASSAIAGSEINWFQGTLDEAFSRPRLRRGAAAAVRH